MTIPILRFRELMDKYLSGILTEPERAELKELLQEASLEPELEGYFRESFYVQANLAAVPEQWLAKVQQQINRAIDQQAQMTASPSAHRVPFLKTAWFRYAAVFLLMAGAATFLYQVNRPQKDIAQQPPTIVQPLIQPGGNKAILTLANGTTIVLDSAANGQLAQQSGVKVIKTSDGRLEYETGGGALPESNKQLSYNTMRTPKGGQYNLRLPDGTRVWLNALSAVTYPVVFSGDQRVVNVEGEAYFEVAADKDRPFMVQAGELDIQVLGTGFNVNTYQEEGLLRTTLLEGSIKVIKGANSVILKPGEQASMLTEGKAGKITVLRPDTEEVLAWKNGLFRFNGTDLESIMRQVARWYDVEIVYKNTVHGHFVITIPRDVSLQNVLTIIEQTGSVKCELRGKQVLITQL